jgi:hypothetical protein
VPARAERSTAFLAVDLKATAGVHRSGSGRHRACDARGLSEGLNLEEPLTRYAQHCSSNAADRGSTGLAPLLCARFLRRDIPMLGAYSAQDEYFTPNVGKKPSHKLNYGSRNAPA